MLKRGARTRLTCFIKAGKVPSRYQTKQKRRIIMNKKQVQKRVLQNGKPLALSKFNWDEDTRTFSSRESDLILDFKGINDCTFTARWDCTFNAGADCTFRTGSCCTFRTGSRCTFDTGYNCTFKTGYGCVIVRRDEFEVIQPKQGQTIQLCPFGVKGHLVDGVKHG